jgi:hypothetical protein
MTAVTSMTGQLPLARLRPPRLAAVQGDSILSAPGRPALAAAHRDTTTNTGAN